MASVDLALGMAEPLVYNPYSFKVHDNPFDTYRRLRDEAPAYWNPDLEFWALSRFDDVQQAFRDYGTYSSAGGVALEARRPIDRAHPKYEELIEMDPPEHTVLRGLVSRVFTPRRVAGMEDEVRRVVNHYIDQVVESGQADLMVDLAGCFPMDVISAVLGIPAADRDMVRECADRGLIREDGSMEIPQEAVEAIFEVLAYFAEDLARRRNGEVPGGGLISDLLELEVDGRALTEKELLGFCLLFSFAGFETTAKMVANAVELLSLHPDQRAALIADPSLTADAVEEVIRFNTLDPVHASHPDPRRRDVRPANAGGRLRVAVDRRGPTRTSASSGRPPDSSTSSVVPTVTSASGTASTSASAPRWPASRAGVALEEIHRRMGDYTVDHENKVRFHSGNVSGWENLPISFTPGPRLQSVTA